MNGILKSWASIRDILTLDLGKYILLANIVDKMSLKMLNILSSFHIPLNLLKIDILCL